MCVDSYLEPRLTGGLEKVATIEDEFMNFQFLAILQLEYEIGKLRGLVHPGHKQLIKV